MHFSQESLEKLLGNNPRGRHKKEAEKLDRYFTNPIIHKQIKGDMVYVPLNLNRIWDQIG